MDDNGLEKKTFINKIPKRLIFNIFLGVVFFLFLFLFIPFNNKDTIIHISSGESIKSISLELKNKNAIKSEFILKSFIKLLKNNNGIISGDYLIKENSPVWLVAWQISRGNYGISPVKITLREGLTNIQIANLLENKLLDFKKDLFLEKIKDKQGYLFPDTYFFFPLDTIDEIILKLSNNFNKKINSLNLSKELNSKELSDIIIMASILEGEAKGKEDIGIISGILWKRISINMPLGVDVDKSTYNIKGLPSKPLNNPGLVSIIAASNPINSPYLYYIHDKNGEVHYSKNFEEHKSNINKYLK